MSEWVDEFIEKVDEAATSGKGLFWIDGDGNKIVVKVKTEVVALLRENRFRLLKVGKKIFQEFLFLLSKGEDFKALVKINETLDNSDLLDQYKADSIKLAEAAAQIQADKQFWVDFGRQASMKILLGALGALL